MYIQNFIFIAASLGMTGLASAAPSDAERQYFTSYPACSVNGFNAVPGNYNVTERFKGGKFGDCINSCRTAFPSCQSISFIYNKDDSGLGDCMFYDKQAKDTNLYYEQTSKFLHYDLICPGPTGPNCS